MISNEIPSQNTSNSDSSSHETIIDNSLTSNSINSEIQDSEIQSFEIQNPGILNPEILLELVTSLLTLPKMPEIDAIDPAIRALASFQGLYEHIADLRELSHTLNRGDLQKHVKSRGYVVANMKSLQANLKHLTWQTKKIAEGDFSQKVDFMGDFSRSFNEMTVKLQEATSDLIRTASLDTLTQLPNRASLDKFIDTAFEHARRQAQSLSVLLFDIDHFKSVNDTYGHDVGDALLRRFSAVVCAQFRAQDCFGRYGGEEFLAVLPGTPCHAAEKIAQRCIRALRLAELAVPGASLNLTASVGFSSLQPSDPDYLALIKRCDLALYDAKLSGRDCVRGRN